MRLVTLDSREVGGRPAVWLPGGEILDLAVPPEGLTAAQWRPQSVVSVLAAGDEGLQRVGRMVREVASAGEPELLRWRAARRLLPATGTQLLTPVRRPGLLLMVPGGATRLAGHYVKNPNAAAGPEAKIRMPGGRNGALQAQCMLGLVIGRPLFQGSTADALRAIAAITLVADLGTGSRNSGDQAARQFPGACVTGPALVTLDEFQPDAGWTLQARINGHTVVSGAPPVTLPASAAAVAELSSSYAFRPGDIIGLAFGVAELPLGDGDRLALGVPSSALPELGFSVSAN